MLLPRGAFNPRENAQPLPRVTPRWGLGEGQEFRSGEEREDKWCLGVPIHETTCLDTEVQDGFSLSKLPSSS